VQGQGVTVIRLDNPTGHSLSMVVPLNLVQHWGICHLGNKGLLLTLVDGRMGQIMMQELAPLPQQEGNLLANPTKID